MKHALLPALVGLLLSACDTTTSAPLADQSPAEALAECRDLGFADGTAEIQKCIDADSRAERRVLIDMETYGTF